MDVDEHGTARTYLAIRRHVIALEYRLQPSSAAEGRGLRDAYRGRLEILAAPSHSPPQSHVPSRS